MRDLPTPLTQALADFLDQHQERLGRAWWMHDYHAASCKYSLARLLLDGLQQCIGAGKAQDLMIVGRQHGKTHVFGRGTVLHLEGIYFNTKAPFDPHTECRKAFKRYQDFSETPLEINFKPLRSLQVGRHHPPFWDYLQNHTGDLKAHADARLLEAQTLASSGGRRKPTL